MGTPLLNARHETFCQGIASGLAIHDAYSTAFGEKSVNVGAVCGHKLLKKPNIASRISELQEENATKSLITREELLKILVDTLKSKPIEAGMENALCELKMSKAGPYAAFMDKTRAAERLCKMLGWDAAEKVEHSGSIGNQVQLVMPSNFISRRGVTHGVS